MSTGSSGELRIRLIGGFSVAGPKGPVPDAAWRLRKAADLVKLLALAPGHRLPRDQVLDVLWPDMDPAAAANNLYQALHVARTALDTAAGRDALRLRSGMVELGGALRVATDVEDFGAAVAAAWTDDHALAAALSEHPGVLLPDDPYDEWAIAPRESLALDQARALTRLADLAEQRGDRGAAIDHLRALAAIQPFEEAIVRRLMTLEAVAGSPGLALRRFDRLVDALRDELGVAPSDETAEIRDRILDGRLRSLPATRRALPARLTTFIGRERELRDLRDLLVSTRAVTLTGTGGTGKTRLALELAEAEADRHADGVLLVELAAVGQANGVARAIADALAIREPPGVTMLERVVDELRLRDLLVVLDNCEHLVEASATVAQQLLDRCPGVSLLATSRQPLRISGEVVFRVPSLPVVDPDQPLGPAELEDVDSVRLFVDRARAADASFTLTEANADDVARLCYHLDGLPLAVELAASRIAAMPVDQLVGRLDQRFRLLVSGNRTALTRQQTLRATIDWSYELLAESQRLILRTLSVLPGGWSLDVAESICALAGIERIDVAPAVAELVDQSLLSLDRSGSTSRYRFTETIRQYAHERLVEGGGDRGAGAALLAWALTRAREGTSDPIEAGGRAFRGLEDDHDNLRAALAWGLEHDPGRALAVAESLWPLWLWDGHLAEGRRWLAAALDRKPARDARRAGALLGLAALTGRSGQPIEGGRSSTEAAAIARELGDRSAESRALQFDGIAAWSADDLERAEATFAESLRVADGDRLRAGAAKCGLAVVLWTVGRRAEAYQLIDAGLADFTADPHGNGASGDDDGAADNGAIGDEIGRGVSDRVPPMIDVFEVLVGDGGGPPRLVFQETAATFRDVRPASAVGHALGNRAMFHRADASIEPATRDLERSLATYRAAGDRWGVAQALGRLGNLAAAEGEFGGARRLLRECLDIRRELGDSRGLSLAECALGDLETSAGNLDDAESLLGAALESFRRRGDRWGIAGTLECRARLALARDDRPASLIMLEEAIETARSTGRLRWVAWWLVRFAVLAGSDDAAGARPALALAEAAGIFEQIREPLGQAAVGLVRATIESDAPRNPLRTD